MTSSPPKADLTLEREATRVRRAGRILIDRRNALARSILVIPLSRRECRIVRALKPAISPPPDAPRPSPRKRATRGRIINRSKP